jgi:hypothetical protein
MYVKLISSDREIKDFCYEPLKSGGNIVYKETQPGTDVSFECHIISIAVPYKEYKPYHERCYLRTLFETKSEFRQKKLEELLGI